MDMSGIEPDPSRMLSERDNQLHHMPVVQVPLGGYIRVVEGSTDILKLRMMGLTPVN